MDLYGFAGSPNTWKVRAAAHHIGVPLTYRHVDLLKGENRQSAFLRISPSGRTPALVDGELMLTESTAIMQYVASRKPNPLWPADDATRARIMQWQSWQLQHWGHDACEPYLLERIVKPLFGMGAPDEGVLAQAERALQAEGALLEGHLADKAWLVGAGPTLADFSVGAYLHYADMCGLPLGSLPRTSTWFGRLAALPCWAATAPPPM